MDQPELLSETLLAGKGGLLIDGRWVAAQSGETLDVFDPATGEVIARVAAAGAADVDLAVAAARKAFDGGRWSRLTPGERGRLIWRLADLVERDAAKFARLDCVDNGKPLKMAEGDVGAVVEGLRYMAGWATKLTGTVNPLSHRHAHHSFTAREPVGVAALIVPWNFPLLMATGKLGPALAAGCAVMLKSAEQTPLSALLLGELVLEAGFPAGAVNILSGHGETAGAAMAAHPLVDKVSFTGSTAVGREVARAATGNMKRVSLELGGKSPVIVMADADVAAAVRGAGNAIFYNQGQVCTAGSRLYVHRSLYDKVVGGVVERAGTIKVGPGLEPASEMGPLVSDEQMARVLGYVDSGRADGAEVLAGGGRIGNRGYFVQPTVLAGVRREMAVVREEIFGPVLVVEAFDDDNLGTLAGLANATQYGLAASVWTRDTAKALKLAERIRAGTVWVNCHGVYDPALPFGGYGASGWGRESGDEAVLAYTERKSVTVKL
jgi:phenylacetaldehyde dehydrogenase